MIQWFRSHNPVVHTTWSRGSDHVIQHFISRDLGSDHVIQLFRLHDPVFRCCDQVASGHMTQCFRPCDPVAQREAFQLYLLPFSLWISLLKPLEWAIAHRPTTSFGIGGSEVCGTPSGGLGSKYICPLLIVYQQAARSISCSFIHFSVTLTWVAML